VLRRALREAQPGAEPTGDGGYRWVESNDIVSDAPSRVVACIQDTSLELTATYSSRVPYFFWLFDPLTRGSVRRRLTHVARTVEALADGTEPPSPPKRAVWAPPSAMTSAQVRAVATLSLLMALTEYASSLLTQTIDFVAKSFHATNAQLGVLTAVTRVGNLIVLVGGVLADRIGRRRLLLVTVSVVLVATSLSALAPTLWTYGFLQVIVNGGTNLAFLVGFIAAMEEAPEDSRTYTIAIVGIAAALGFVVGAILLPVADVRPGAWRGMYAIGALGLLFLPTIGRSLRETRRFAALVARQVRGRVGEVVDKRYGSRFALMCLTGYLLNVYFAPQSQFTNRYLADERGFSGLGILVLRAVTQTATALIAAYGGGRLAESVGRKPVARWGLVVGAAATAAFFIGGGPLLWVTFAVSTMGQSGAAPALSAFTSELFPTEVRGTAGAGLTITGVMGSATGLLLSGYLAKPFGSIGKAVALTCIAPVIVGVFLINRLPEAKGVLLDDVSPSEV